MGRKKKGEKVIPQGVTIKWIGGDGVVKEEKHIAISDNYRLMRSYVNCIKHLERQVWEIQEGIKLDAWKGRSRK